MDSSQSKTSLRTLLGSRGEEYARAYLQQHGYDIVAANFTLPVGRNLRGAIVTAEIDLIAYDGPVLCFIEVKTRASDWFAPPQVNIDRRKQRQISRAARAYRRMLGLVGERYRFDVVTVVLPSDPGDGRFRIELLRNYWTDAKFRKSRNYESYYD